MPQTLAQLVKAKYPGTYDQLSDTELEAKVIAKYPGVYDAVPKTTGAGVMVNGQPMGIDDYNETQQTKPRTWTQTAIETAKGFGKGALRTVADLEEAPLMIPGMSRALDAVAGDSVAVSDRLRQHTAAIRSENTYANTPQMVGGGLEALAELAIPVTKAAEAIPTTAKAGAKFQEVMGAARHFPVDVNAPGQVALRINELAERGGSMPMAVRKFLNRVTDPNKPGMVYEEARDFASNISRLSANEFQRLTPVVAKEVAALRVTLNQAVAQAASKAGKGKEYAQAMNEYARAMRLKKAVDAAVEGAKRAVPLATAGGVGYWLTAKVRQALGE